MKNCDGTRRVLTLGLSNQAPEQLMARLAEQHITALVDVRSQPYSKYASWFNKAELETLIRGAGLAYVYLGKELGGMPRDPALLGEDGKADYAKIAASAAFSQGLERLRTGLDQGWNICLACAEADPSHCHRQHLIAPALAAQGVGVVHILKDGGLIGWHELRGRERAANLEQGRLL